MTSPSKSIVCLSGGLDSCVATAMAIEAELEPVMAISFFYNQKHSREIEAAQEIARYYKLRHSVIYLDSITDPIKGASALLRGSDLQLAQDRSPSASTGRIPTSYVPGRNTIMLAIAQSIAEANNLDHIITGFQATDYNGYPDTREIYIQAWNSLAHYATKRGYYNNPISVIAPLVNMSKASVVHHGLRLHAPLHLTTSCYVGGETACGRCDSCNIRRAAFRENGQEDPITYAEV